MDNENRIQIELEVMDSSVYERNAKYCTNKKGKEKMSTKVYDIAYENAAQAIRDEKELAVRAAEAKQAEALAKAEEERELARIRADADRWAAELYARYDALRKNNFSEELAIELIKIALAN